MNDEFKVSGKILSALFLTTIAFLFLFLILELNLPNRQPVGPGAAVRADNVCGFVNVEQLQALGVDTEALEAANQAAFDLKIEKKTALTQVNAGQPITFNISVTNNGPNSVSYVCFYDDYPPEMRRVAYDFAATAVSNGLAKPTWLLPVITSGKKILITVTGVLTSGPDKTVVNSALVGAWNATGDTRPNNNVSTAKVNIIGFQDEPITETAYMPYVQYTAPTPTPNVVLAYREDFAGNDDDDEDWIETDEFDDCKTEIRSNQYWVDVESSDNRCLPPANNDARQPEEPFRTYGEFEVEAYHSEDLNDNNDDLSNARYGLFINGAGGGTQYVFRIAPNNGCSSGGGWELIRNRDDDPDDDDGGASTTLRQENCNGNIRRGGTRNKLKIVHAGNREIIVYANDAELGRFPENESSELRGRANGVYVLSDETDVRIKYDYFEVRKFVD